MHSCPDQPCGKPHCPNPACKPEQDPPLSMDYREFIDRLSCLLNIIWGEDWGRLVMKRPNVHEGVKNTDMPVITYVLKELVPGEVGQNGTVERKPRQRNSYSYTDDNGDSQFVRTEGQILDATLEFAIYAESNNEALALSEALREAMNTYKGYFRKCGLYNLWFKREHERAGNEQRRDDMATRGLEYLVRFEELTEINPKRIESILVEVDATYSRLGLEGKLPSQSND